VILMFRFTKVDDRDEWIWAMDLFRRRQLRYGRLKSWTKVSVVIPKTFPGRVMTKWSVWHLRELKRGDAAKPKPSACHSTTPRHSLPPLRIPNRRAVNGGPRSAVLRMMLQCDSGSVEQAAAEHQRVVGFYPVHIEKIDSWRWKISTSASDGLRREPTHVNDNRAFQRGDPIGLMEFLYRLDPMNIAVRGRRIEEFRPLGALR